MNTADAVYEYLKSEIVPMIAGNSEFTGALINGALRSSRKKLAGKLAENNFLKTLGLIDDSGKIDQEAFADFADGFFENKESVPLPMADLLGAITGIDTSSPLLVETLKLLPGVDAEVLQDKIKFTRADADKFLELLKK